MSINKVIQTIKKHKKFLISTHVNPDPDALCSELALAIYLRSIGKKVTVVNNEEVPKRYKFLPGTNKIKGFKDILKVDFDVAIVVDCGDLGRIGCVESLIKDHHVLVNIDHHVTNDSFGHVNLVKVHASSTAEVLYDLLKSAKCKFDNHLAIHLYCGIMTDTGAFRYENTSADTHRIVAELRQYKFSAYDLYRRLYEMVPLNDIQLFTKVIGQFESLSSGKILCVNLRKRVISSFSKDFDLRDTIFRYLRSIQGVEAIVIFSEVERNKTRVNLRSVEKVNVAKIANHYDGGGHRRAAGCLIEKDLKKAKAALLKELKKVV